MEIIEAKRLKKSFDKVIALDGIDLTVKKGEIFGLVGPDGAGKTTMIRLLTSVMMPTSGDGWVDGSHIVRDAEAIKEKIGYMSQKFGLYGDLTVLENIHFYSEIYGVPRNKKKEQAEKLLTYMDLYRFKDRRADALSGGMKQKLGLACALIHTPKVLFLDEPTNGVDPISRREFWHILYELHKKETTIFLSTAYMDEAERCGNVAFMYKGQIMAQGSPEYLKSHLKGLILEVRCQAPRKTLLGLREFLGSDCVKLFGNRIHIYIYAENPGHSLQEVKELLDKLKLGNYEIKESQPSLEDVFMSLMKEREKEDEDVRY